MCPRCLYSRADLELDLAVQRILVSDYLDSGLEKGCVFSRGESEGLREMVVVCGFGVVGGGSVFCGVRRDTCSSTHLCLGLRTHSWVTNATFTVHRLGHLVRKCCG